MSQGRFGSVNRSRASWLHQHGRRAVFEKKSNLENTQTSAGCLKWLPKSTSEAGIQHSCGICAIQQRERAAADVCVSKRASGIRAKDLHFSAFFCGARISMSVRFRTCTGPQDKTITVPAPTQRINPRIAGASNVCQGRMRPNFLEFHLHIRLKEFPER